MFYVYGKSISTGAQYANLHIKKLDEQNSTYAGLAQENVWFLSCIFAEAGIKRSKAVHLLEKRVINMV
jgi:hypothetical protein